MKKVIISLICLVILAVLYACGNIGNQNLKPDGNGLPTEDPSDQITSNE